MDMANRGKYFRALAIFHNPHFLGKRQPLATIGNHFQPFSTIYGCFSVVFPLIISYPKFFLIPCVMNIAVVCRHQSSFRLLDEKNKHGYSRHITEA
jgi:hypothetical protein